MDTIYEFCGNSATAKVEFFYPCLVGKSAEHIFLLQLFSINLDFLSDL
jgi:hypothetical protein